MHALYLLFILCWQSSQFRLFCSFGSASYFCGADIWCISRCRPPTVIKTAALHATICYDTPHHNIRCVHLLKLTYWLSWPRVWTRHGDSNQFAHLHHCMYRLWYPCYKHKWSRRMTEWPAYNPSSRDCGTYWPESISCVATLSGICWSRDRTMSPTMISYALQIVFRTNVSGRWILHNGATASGNESEELHTTSSP